MSWKLVSEVLTHSPEGLAARDRLILVTIAEEAREGSRTCSPGPGELARRVGLSRRGLRRAMQRLAEHGLDPRVPISEGRDGRPVFAVPGTLQTYRVPVMDPASLQVSLGGTHVPPGGTVVPPGDTPGVTLAALQGSPGGTPGGRQGAPEVSPGVPPGGPPPQYQGPVPPPEDIDRLVDELERVVVVLLSRHSVPRPTSRVLRKELARMARLQWTPEQLQASLEGISWAGAGAGVVITNLRDLQRLDTASRGPVRPSGRPEWCGECHEPTRMLTDRDNGSTRRCPACHPNTHARKDPA